jgi:hypothetical protein
MKKDLHLTFEWNARHLARDESEFNRVSGKEYQTHEEKRDYSKYEKGQKDDLIRCPVCWKDIPAHKMWKCVCGMYTGGITADTWKEEKYLEEHYRFLRLQRHSIFDDHMKVSLERYYNEYYVGSSCEYLWKFTKKD